MPTANAIYNDAHDDKALKLDVKWEVKFAVGEKRKTIQKLQRIFINFALQTRLEGMSLQY
jgi:hypothetical protein